MRFNRGGVALSRRRKEFFILILRAHNERAQQHNSQQHNSSSGHDSLRLFDQIF
jgi:hypothetical protein